MSRRATRDPLVLAGSTGHHRRDVTHVRDRRAAEGGPAAARRRMARRESARAGAWQDRARHAGRAGLLGQRRHLRQVHVRERRRDRDRARRAVARHALRRGPRVRPRGGHRHLAVRRLARRRGGRAGGPARGRSDDRHDQQPAIAARTDGRARVRAARGTRACRRGDEDVHRDLRRARAPCRGDRGGTRAERAVARGIAGGGRRGRGDVVRRGAPGEADRPRRRDRRPRPRVPVRRRARGLAEDQGARTRMGRAVLERRLRARTADAAAARDAGLASVLTRRDRG